MSGLGHDTIPSAGQRARSQPSTRRQFQISRTTLESDGENIEPRGNNRNRTAKTEAAARLKETVVDSQGDPDVEIATCMLEMQQISAMLRLKHAKLRDERKNWTEMKRLIEKNLQAECKRLEDAAFERVNSKVSDTFSTLEDVVASIRGRVVETSGLQTRLEKAEAALEAERRAHKQERYRLHSEVERLLQENAELKNAQGSSAAQSAKLKTKLSRSNIQTQQLRAHIVALEQENKDFRAVLDSKSSSIDSLKYEVSALKKKVKVLKWQKAQQTTSSGSSSKAAEVAASKRTARVGRERHASDDEEDRTWKVNVLQCISYFSSMQSSVKAGIRRLSHAFPAGSRMLPDWTVHTTATANVHQAHEAASITCLDQTLPGLYGMLKDSIATMRLECLAEPSDEGVCMDGLTTCHKEMLQLQSALLHFAWEKYFDIPYKSAHRHYLLQRFIDLLHGDGQRSAQWINVAEATASSQAVPTNDASEFVSVPIERGTHSSETADSNSLHRLGDMETAPLGTRIRPDIQCLAAGLTLRLCRTSAITKLQRALKTLVHNLTGVQPFPSTRGVRNPDHGCAIYTRIFMLESGFLPIVAVMMQHRHSAVQRDACKVIGLLLSSPQQPTTWSHGATGNFSVAKATSRSSEALEIALHAACGSQDFLEVLFDKVLFTQELKQPIELVRAATSLLLRMTTVFQKRLRLQHVSAHSEQIYGLDCESSVVEPSKALGHSTKHSNQVFVRFLSTHNFKLLEMAASSEGNHDVAAKLRTLLQHVKNIKDHGRRRLGENSASQNRSLRDEPTMRRRGLRLDARPTDKQNEHKKSAVEQESIAIRRYLEDSQSGDECISDDWDAEHNNVEADSLDLGVEESSTERHQNQENAPDSVSVEDGNLPNSQAHLNDRGSEFEEEDASDSETRAVGSKFTMSQTQLHPVPSRQSHSRKTAPQTEYNVAKAPVLDFRSIDAMLAAAREAEEAALQASRAAETKISRHKLQYGRRDVMPLAIEHTVYEAEDEAQSSDASSEDETTSDVQ